jgi:hypothetical protein
MSDSFKLNGSYQALPLAAPLSFAPTVTANIDEALTLNAKQISEMTLNADAPAAVAFGGVTNAHIVILKADNKVKALITSADGAAQAVPFDTYWILMSESVPVTAITLTRVPGTVTTVRVFLAEKA